MRYWSEREHRNHSRAGFFVRNDFILSLQTEMISTAVFVVVLFASIIGSSQAVSCYQCNYTRSYAQGNQIQSGCGGLPFNPNTNKKCSAPICSWQLTNYPAPTNYTFVQYDCANFTGMAPTDPCAQYRSLYSVFTYANSCCYTTQGMDSNGSFSMTHCLCQSDNCNGNVQESVGPSTPAPPSMGIPVLKTPIWAVLAVTFIAMVAIFG